MGLESRESAQSGLGFWSFISILAQILQFALTLCTDTCHNRKRDLTQAPHLMDFFRGLVFATMSDANGLAARLQTIDENVSFYFGQLQIFKFGGAELRWKGWMMQRWTTMHPGSTAGHWEQQGIHTRTWRRNDDSLTSALSIASHPSKWHVYFLTLKVIFLKSR